MNIIDNPVRDVRYAVRTLTRNPGFTLAALGALVLGIGANTAVFSVLNGVLLRPLPYADPDRLVIIFDSFQQQGLERGPAGIADFLDWKARARSFHTLDAIANQRFTLVGDGEAEQIVGMSVTATFFETLGIRPLLGRTFACGDDQPGRAQSVVISERLWRRRYGSSAAIVGKEIVMNGRPFTIIGVMPDGRSPTRQLVLQRLLTDREIRRNLRRAGFEQVRFFDGIDVRPPIPEARRGYDAYYLARKPARV